VVTEYGAADLRGASDRDVIAALLNIADSRFQQGLLVQAIAAGKIEPEYRIPEACQDNSPERVRSMLLSAGEPGWFPHFPWRTEMTPEEAALAVALVAVNATGRPLTLPARQATAGSSPPPTGPRPGTNGTRFTDHA
jgi:hypothetical protein